MQSTMRQLFDKYKCDKGSKHGYEAVYEEFIQYRRMDEINLLEVGVFKGASTSAWHEYLPNANIYGIDLFTRVRMQDVPILNDKRVHAINHDSTAGDLPDAIRHDWGKDIKFDIIIDDGAHYPKANLWTFRNLFQFLAPGGIYFIEDVWPLERMSQKELQHEWLRKHAKDYTMADNQEFVDELMQYRHDRFDLRITSGKPDSYIIGIFNDVSAESDS